MMAPARTFVVAMLAMLGIAAAPAHAFQGPWVTPGRALPPGAESARAPDVAVADDGTATAVWEQSDGQTWTTRASIRLPGGAFGPPTTLSPVGNDAEGSVVATSPAGTTAVVWTAFYDLSNRTVHASMRLPGGVFGEPVELSTPGRVAAAGADVVVAPDGSATVIWSEGGSGVVRTVRASTRAPGGSFGAPVTVSDGVDPAQEPAVAVGRDGATTAVWSSFDGSASVAQASTRAPGGSFGAPVDLSAAGQDVSTPQVTTAPDGRTTAVWVRSNGSNSIVQAAARAPGGAFGAPVDLSAPGQDALRPDIAAGADGTVIAVWDRTTPTGRVIQGSVRPPGGTFSAPVDVSAEDVPSRGPRVAIADDGTATAVWIQGTLAQSSTRPPGGAFSAPITLAVDGTRPRVALAPDGSATAVWQDASVRGAFTANPPSLRRAPAIVRPGAPAGLLACDGGAWTGAATVGTSWLRDGVLAATGPTYAVDQGTTAVLCRAEANNPFGSVEALSLPVVIPGTGAPQGFPPVQTPPRALDLPRLTGVARPGRRLRCRAAQFSGAAAITTSWLRTGVLVRGAHRPSYPIRRRDVGKIITCRTRATNLAGTSTVVSLGRLVRK